MTLRPYARETVHRMLSSARSSVAFNRRNEYNESEARAAYFAAEELWRECASMFARFTLDGDTETAAALTPMLRLARRYYDVCKLAYLGARP